MTTKALICFERSAVSIRKHFDGTPEYTLPVLEAHIARAPMFDPVKGGSPAYREEVYELELSHFISDVLQQFAIEDFLRSKDDDEGFKVGKRWFAGGYEVHDRRDPHADWHWKFLVHQDGSIHVSPAEGPAYVRTYAQIVTAPTQEPPT